MRQWQDRDRAAFVVLSLVVSVTVVVVFVWTQSASPSVQAQFLASAAVGIAVQGVLPLFHLALAALAWKSGQKRLAQSLGAPDVFIDPRQAFALLEIERVERKERRSAQKQAFLEQATRDEEQHQKHQEH